MRQTDSMSCERGTRVRELSVSEEPMIECRNQSILVKQHGSANPKWSLRQCWNTILEILLQSSPMKEFRAFSETHTHTRTHANVHRYTQSK